MNGYSLRFYMHENQKHHGKLLYEWLLEAAKKREVHGGSAFKAIAGFGRHGQLHEAAFFECAGEQTVLVEFLVSAAEADALVALVQAEKAPLFWARFAADFGVIENH
jgi:PII-like signaling protein